ncbi:MAG TPA: hypothetical protein VJP07_05365 [Dehalococcoidia bacterium]|nr:hypothetical protein [Dehalococcoidia bacterium]
MRLDLGPQRDPRKLALMAGAAAALGALLFAAGYGANALFGGDDDKPSSAVAATPSPGATRTRTPAASPTRTITATTAAAPTAAAPVSTRPPSTLLPLPPTPTPTIDPAAQPAIEVVSIDPPVGTEVTAPPIPITVNVNYQAGPVSNVLGWTIEYCYSSIDCNTYSLASAYEVVPGSSGPATLTSLFSIDANYLRPAVICRYTVVIGHFLTPEVKWQSQAAADERCDQPSNHPTIRVVEAAPGVGTVLDEGEVVSVFVAYEAGSANQLLVSLYMNGCRLSGRQTLEISPGSSTNDTVDVVTSPPASGRLERVDVQLLDAGIPIASYTLGACE